MTRRAAVLLVVLAALALAGPWVAPYDAGRAFRGFVHAPPMFPRLSEGLGVYPLVLVDRVEQRFVEDRTRTLGLPWRGESEPVFLLGADRDGRDVFSRMLSGARLSIGLGLVSVLGATLLGSLLGAWAASRGGWMDEAVMRSADFLLLLPIIYVVLVLRAMLPLVLAPSTVFALMAVIFTAVGWPFVARGVHAVVAREREQRCVLAARSLGAGPGRILWRHLLPACAGHVAVQASLLLPAFILAEATLSYVGLGFPDPLPSWGRMLADAGNVNNLARFPWTLAPAGAIFAVTFATNAALQARVDHRIRCPEQEVTTS